MAEKYDPFLAETGDRIRESRKRKNLSQMDLAERIGGDCSKSVISRYENGRKEMGIKRFAELISALEVSPNEIICPGKFQAAEAGSMFANLSEDNKAIIITQMQALLIMQNVKAGGRSVSTEDDPA